MSVFFEPAAGDDDPDVDAPRPTRARRVRKVVVRCLVVVAALAVIVSAAAGLYVGSVSKSFTGSLHRETLLPTTHDLGAASTDDASRPKKASSAALDFVLMGSDSRDKGDAGAGRSDTLMLLHLNADRKAAYLISFPRDMYVSIPGHGKNKINAAFSFGGVPLAVETLEKLLGTQMDHVAVIDFDGFITLTEQLGGVTVYNEHASASRGYTFPKGTITIKGDQALAFVRERYDLPSGDLDRAERQRLVVQAILKKAASAEVLADPAKFTKVAGTIGDNITVDQDLSDAQIRRVILSVRFEPGDIKLLQAPITGFGNVGGQSIDVVDHAGVAALGRALRKDDMDAYVKDSTNR